MTASWILKFSRFEFSAICWIWGMMEWSSTTQVPPHSQKKSEIQTHSWIKLKHILGFKLKDHRMLCVILEASGVVNVTSRRLTNSNVSIYMHLPIRTFLIVSVFACSTFNYDVRSPPIYLYYLLWAKSRVLNSRRNTRWGKRADGQIAPVQYTIFPL